MFYDRYTSLPRHSNVARSFSSVTFTPLELAQFECSPDRCGASVGEDGAPVKFIPTKAGINFFESAPHHQLPEHLMSRDDGTVLVLVALGLERTFCGHAYVVGLVLG